MFIVLSLFYEVSSSFFLRFCLFFFFKQKTAYEMRISDWSSDVCSSDLVLLTQQRIISVNDKTRQRIGKGRLVFAQFEIHVFYLGSEKHAREIGRASCRERVCQYV